ncbi:uncharacterized protein BP5553_00654 [Venustampulla echinocandica]|uniref:Uncharacterized protein n=1 Tax=Venustampulla echinocandica TaxID=2656787 RepID=A0A370TYS5_9HELO|nr:uncharacterized protein BP5553_00654 [Venustampulla echinocandica]RDL40675.1 hypothetical protein BP5553_00654 [Venustampulla echinocandica]
MATLKALPALIRESFKRAQDSGDLTFYPTQVAILTCSGFPFQLRFSPALANKPKSNKPKGSKPVDPFENPAKGLFISDLQPSHYLVLNKFPVTHDHFILATREFKEQTDLLEKDDLAAAYQCLKNYRENGEELFGFFNSGEHSGASQPHRHIQFLPVDSMRTGIQGGPTWSILADKLIDSNDFPFTYFASQVPNNATPSQLHSLYLEMHAKACQIGRLNHTTLHKTTRKEESPISYNLGLTNHVMVLCPRTSEGPKISSATGEIIGPIALNGTILGGTLLVKNEEEWQALRNDESKLMDILDTIGIPSAKNET